MPDELEPQDENESTRPFWSGTITFGLVSIPVSLYTANRSSRVSLRMLGPEGRPLQRRYFSAKTGRALGEEDIVRGYEMEDGRYVVVTDEELERLAPEKSRDIDLRRFVAEDQIPKLYFERGYFLVPAGGSTKAYRLLAETMEQTRRAGIATFVMRGNEYLVAILSDNGILRAETLRFADEIRSPEAIGLPRTKKPDPKAVRAMEKWIGEHETTTVPRKEMADVETDRLRRLAEKKAGQRKNVVGRAKRGREKAPVVDLLEVLQRSLASSAKSRVA